MNKLNINIAEFNDSIDSEREFRVTFDQQFFILYSDNARADHQPTIAVWHVDEFFTPIFEMNCGEQVDEAAAALTQALVHEDVPFNYNHLLAAAAALKVFWFTDYCVL